MDPAPFAPLAPVSVLIVAYRSRATLPGVFEALSRQTRAPAEILVLENGSPDAEQISEADIPDRVTFIHSETNLGFAGGNNLLARKASQPWLLLLNPDAFPEPDWIEALMKAADRWPDTPLFGCTQLAHGSPGHLDGVGDVVHITGIPYRGGYGLQMEPPEDGEVFGPCGAAALIRRDVFERLGGFDNDYFCYVEDVDLAYRARLLGFRCIQVSSAIVSHIGYASSGRRSEFATSHGVRNRLWTVLKNTPLPAIPIILPLHVVATASLWFWAFRSNQFRVFGGALKDALKDWPNVMRKRRAVQAERTASTAAILAAMSWHPFKLLTRKPDIRPIKPPVDP